MNVQINAPRLGVGFGSPIIREGGGEPYTGDYEVTPSAETQTLETAGKKLSQDVTINPIPSGWYNTTTETWTFTLSDNSTVTKSVVVAT